jgi:secreted trypsin-like serine protease
MLRWSSRTAFRNSFFTGVMGALLPGAALAQEDGLDTGAEQVQASPAQDAEDAGFARTYAEKMIGTLGLLGLLLPGIAYAQNNTPAVEGNEQIREIGGGVCEPRPLRDYAEKMVGGDVTTAALWPGIVALGAESESKSSAMYNCGGVLLNANTVLTAAHCLNYSEQDPETGAWSIVFGNGAKWPMVVTANLDDLAQDDPETAARVIGGEVISEAGRAYTVDEIGTQNNDIAILKLDRDLPGPYAKLSGGIEADPAIEGHLLWAAGFGTTDANNQDLTSFDSRRGPARTSAPAQILSDAILQFKPQNICSPANLGVISDSMHICAGWDEGMRDSCQGDSGGPLTVLDGDGCPVVVGLTSFGNGCGQAGKYGIYTRVSQYRDWIESRVSDVEFVEASPPAAGQEAFKRMVDAVLDAGAAGADKVETQLVQNNRAVDGALKEGQTYRLRIRSEIEGNVMVVDKNESGFYDLVFPYFETDDEKIGPDKDVYLPLYAAIQEANATSEEGSLNIFVLPSSVDIRSAFLAPSKTGTKSLRPVAPESGEQLSDEIGRIADLLGLGTSDASTQQGDVASQAFSYRIEK